MQGGIHPGHLYNAVVLALALGLGQVAEHPEPVAALFIGALPQGGLHQADAGFPQHPLHQRANGVRQKQVGFAPLAEVLAPVHHAGLVVGQRYRPQGIAAAPNQGGGGPENLRHILDAPVGQNYIQIQQLGLGLVPVAALGLGGVVRQTAIPVFALLRVHQHGVQGAQGGHQHRLLLHLLGRKGLIEVPQGPVVPHTHVLSGLPNQQGMDALLCPALPV